MLGLDNDEGMIAVNFACLGVGATKVVLELLESRSGLFGGCRLAALAKGALAMLAGSLMNGEF